MTTANKITILRILLIPLFVFELLGYRSSGAETQRVLALATFALAAIMDGVDGFVARRFHQRSELGAVLDPAADKLLLVSAVILLSLNRTHLEPLPLWFGVTILSRDVLLSLGALMVYYTVGKVRVRPRWIGKVATVLQMSVVLWAMLKFHAPYQYWIALAAALCTAISGLQYLFDGMQQVSGSPHSQAAKPPPRSPA